MLYEYRRSGIEIEYTGGTGSDFWRSSVHKYCDEIGLKCNANGRSGEKWDKKNVDIAVAQDGSVTAPGMELQTRPFHVQDEYFVTRFKKLMLHIVANGGAIDRSCGLHVHISAKHSTTLFITNLYTFYYKWQNAMYSLVDPSRDGNNYAKRIEINQDVLKRIKDLKSSTKLTSVGICTDRYQMLNTSLIPSLRNYEIRLCHGMLNPVRILNWVNFHLHIAQYINKLSKDGKELEYQKTRPETTERDISDMFDEIGWQDAIKYFTDELKRYTNKGGSENYAF
jgi:hypothetical protein